MGTLRSFQLARYAPFHSKENVTLFSVLFTMVISLEKYEKCIYVYTVSLSLGTTGIFSFASHPPPLLLGSTKDFYVFLIYFLGICGKECIVIVKWGIVYRVFHFSKLLAPK